MSKLTDLGAKVRPFAGNLNESQLKELRYKMADGTVVDFDVALEGGVVAGVSREVAVKSPVAPMIKEREPMIKEREPMAKPMRDKLKE